MFGLCTVNWILWKFSLLFVYFFFMEYWFVLSIQLDSIEIILHHFYFISFCVVCSPSIHPNSLCLIISFAPHMYTFLNISFYMNLTKKTKKIINQSICMCTVHCIQCFCMFIFISLYKNSLCICVSCHFFISLCLLV